MQGGGDVIIQDENGVVVKTLVFPHLLCSVGLIADIGMIEFLELELWQDGALHKFMK